MRELQRDIPILIWILNSGTEFQRGEPEGAQRMRDLSLRQLPLEWQMYFLTTQCMPRFPGLRKNYRKKFPNFPC